jgi:hypothetical protein
MRDRHAAKRTRPTTGYCFFPAMLQGAMIQATADLSSEHRHARINSTCIVTHCVFACRHIHRLQAVVSHDAWFLNRAHSHAGGPIVSMHLIICQANGNQAVCAQLVKAPVKLLGDHIKLHIARVAKAKHSIAHGLERCRWKALPEHALPAEFHASWGLALPCNTHGLSMGC